MTQEMVERLKQERKRLRLTQAEMADAAKMTLNNYQKYESNSEVDMNVMALRRLAEIGLNVFYVLFNEQLESPEMPVQWEPCTLDHIAERLKQERTRLKFSQKDLADEAEIGLSVYGRYEASQAEMGAKAMIKLAGAGVDTFYLLFGKRLVHFLSAEEQMLLGSFQALGIPERAAALAYIQGINATRRTIRIKGRQNQYVEKTLSANNHYGSGNVLNLHIEKETDEKKN